MDLHLDLSPDGPPLSTQIYRGLVDAILDGRLTAGERLPATRALAQDLAVARTTVVYAYERLIAEGFAVSRVGAGTFIGDDHLGRPRAAATTAAPDGAEGENIPADVRLPAVWDRLPLQWPDTADQAPAHAIVHDFSVGVPDARLFPIDTWRRLVGRQLRSLGPDAGQYGDPAGAEPLREAIARHVSRSRSVRCGPDDIIVTRGAQQAFDLIGRALIEPGTPVAVEDPGYPPARLLFESLGAEVTGVPVTGEGIDVAAIPDGTRLVYVTPSHQFPLGTAMTLSTRASLLAWADEHGAVVIEDDYDTEFRFEDRPLAPLHHLDRSGRVVYVGSFSKTMLPSLRLGFLVAPPSLRPVLRAAKFLTDSHTDPVVQAALAHFLDDGHFAQHLRRARRDYAQRHHAVVAAAEELLSPWLETIPAVAGLHVGARPRPDVAVDVDAVARCARRRGVHVETLTRYCHQRSRDTGFVFGYGNVRGDEIGPALELFGECLADRG